MRSAPQNHPSQHRVKAVSAITTTGLTTLAILLLWPLMGAHDALHFALTAVAIGGFAPCDDSLASFGIGVQIAVLLLALACALPLPLYYRALRQG